MKYLFIIVGDRPQAGKTTTGKHIAKVLAIPHMSTSASINARVEKRLGLSAGTVIAARKVEPDNYRKDLIIEGDAMAAENYPPGVACLDIIGDKGGVIEGIRREQELADTIAAALRRGLKVTVVAITRAGNEADPDNTEPGVMNRADYMIYNNSDVASVLCQVDLIIQSVVKNA